MTIIQNDSGEILGPFEKFGLSIVDAFHRPFDFKGRSSRAAYWNYFIFLLLITLLVDFGFDSIKSHLTWAAFEYVEIARNILLGVCIWVFIPVIARRYHDTGRYWINLLNPTGLISLIVAIPFFVCALFESQEGENPFGPPHTLTKSK